MMQKNEGQFIQLKNITKSYPLPNGTSYKALNGITLRIDKGEFVSIMGPSGSGKSTLMNIIGALDTISTGTYLFKGKDISKYTPDELARIRNKEIGFVFQAYNLLPRISVYKNVERPMIYGGVPKGERKERITSILQMMNIGDKANNISNNISGGEKQRVAIARALIMNPAIILADEPTGNLDSKRSKEIMKILHDLHEKGNTVVVITHDENVAKVAHRKIKIVDGQIVKDTKRD